MPEVLTIVYLVYIFISLYFLFLFALTFVQNRKEMFSYKKSKKNYSISVIIPAHNEEDTIRNTIEQVLKSDYKNILEVIVATNACTDRTVKIARELSKNYKKLKVLNLKIPGKANALNEALKIARGELFAVVDADSYPDTNALNSMVGFFDDTAVGGVTTRILVKHRDNFLRKMQAIEYKVIAFTRKLLDFLDSIYVTPGPLALYRKSALQKIGGFDLKNMTEDIEATWHLIHEGYKVRMSFISKSTTVAPSKLSVWFKQRVRWNIGGFQTIIKYKHCWFRKGMLGYFILPLFSIMLVLSVFGLGIFRYIIFRRIFYTYLATHYSFIAETTFFAFQDINLNPNILNFLGLVSFILGLMFIYFALVFVNKNLNEKENFFSVIFYSLVYILLRPIVLIASMYKFIRGKYSWR